MGKIDQEWLARARKAGADPGQVLAERGGFVRVWVYGNNTVHAATGYPGEVKWRLLTQDEINVLTDDTQWPILDGGESELMLG